jgi:hypothetical protein
MKPLLDSLVREGLVDELMEFVPKRTDRPIEMQDNCRMKREIGRIRCQLAGCTHHLVRDCDEFHDPVQFRRHIGWFVSQDVCLTPIVEYVQKPTTRIKGISGLYVPCVHRIDCQLRRYNPYGLTVDLGRTIFPVERYTVLATDALVLHHFTSVRINETELRRKYQGHGHLNRVGTVGDFVNKVYGYSPDDLEEVPDVFGIQDYWKGEFQQWLS